MDADRWDSACFEYDANPFETSCEAQPDWDKLLIELEAYRKSSPKKGDWPQLGVTYQAGAGLRRIWARNLHIVGSHWRR